MFLKELQVKRQAELGFLCWSTMKMDKDQLARDITTHNGIKCALQWKVIYAGNKGKIPDKDKVQALHVIVNAVGSQFSLDKLSDLYGKSDNGFPNNCKLRFYPHWLCLRSAVAQSKVLKAINSMSKDLRLTCAG